MTSAKFFCIWTPSHPVSKNSMKSPPSAQTSNVHAPPALERPLLFGPRIEGGGWEEAEEG